MRKQTRTWKSRCLSAVVSLAMAAALLPVSPAVQADAADAQNTVNVALTVGETWETEYAYAEGQTGVTRQPNGSIASVTLEQGANVEVSGVRLYPHVANADSIAAAFSAEASSTDSIADCEFTLTKAEGDNMYTAYSESTGKYFVSGAMGSFFSDNSSPVSIAKTENASTFRISQDGSAAFLYFHTPQMNFNRMGAYIANNAPGYELILLEKQETVSQGDAVPGYKAVGTITSGKKYLISFTVGDKVVVLYPQNGGASPMTRLTGDAFTETRGTKSRVRITATGEGNTTAVVDGVTYNITCNVRAAEVINLVPGQKYFLSGASQFTAGDNSVATIAAGNKTTDGLADCLRNLGRDNTVYNLSGYAQTQNTNVSLADAEMLVTKNGEKWNIYNEKANGYLKNEGVANYFAGNEELKDQTITPVRNADGTPSFEICNPGGRYVCWHYPFMTFDAFASKSNDKGDYGFEFLEKQDVITNLDPIPGYKRVSELTSGKKYLITQFINNDVANGIIVLYPGSGLQQSKLYKPVQAAGVEITAVKANSETTVTVDGTTYRVVVGANCQHKGQKRVENMRAATCEGKGSTGETYCAICNTKLSNATETAALGHKYDEGKVTTPVTTTTDGVKTYTCQNDPSHTRTEVISSLDYANQVLAEKLGDARTEAAKTAEYTEATMNTLKAAITAAENVSATDKAAINTAITGLENAMEGLVTKAVQTQLDKINGLLARDLGSLDQYTDASKKAYETAKRNAQNLINNGSQDAGKLETAATKLQEAIDGLVTKAQEERDEAVAVLDEQVLAATEMMMSGAADIFSANSIAALQKALDDAEAVKKDTTKDAAAVLAAADAVKVALEGLTPKTDGDGSGNGNGNGNGNNGTVAVGTPVETKLGRYEVIDPVNKTAKLVSVKNKKAAKMSVPATVKVNGETFKVVEVGANVMKGNKKLTKVILGSNVTTIGKQAFSGCTKLKSVQLKGKALATIGKQAFKKTSAKMIVSAKKLNKKQKAALLKKVKKAGAGKKVKVK